MTTSIDDVEAVMRARVLVVEDEGIVAADLKRGLRAFGYGVSGVAATGREALELALATRPDLLLMDIRLRGELDGIETARLIRARMDVPVVFLTAYADEDTLRRAAGVGPFGYVLKPYDDRELQSAILMALCKHRAFAELDRRVQERTAALARSEARYRQLDIVADLGIFALRSPELAPVLERCVQEAARGLGVELADVLELAADGRTLRLAAGVGFPAALSGQAVVEVSPGAWAAHCLTAAEPVVVPDVGREHRFRVAPFKRAAGMVSARGVVIHGAGEAGRPFGLLEAHSRTLRAFSPDDVSFLQALANLLAAAVLRAENERRLRAAERAAEEERGRAHIAEEALRARDEFLSVASHELRTPVAALQLQLEALRELSAPLRDRGDARIADKAERAAASVARLARLVESVLDVSRIVLGRLRLEPEPLDLAEVAATVTERHVEAARRAGCALRFDGASPLSGAWDRARVEQVLGHLLSNAIKFGAGQPIDVRVEPRPGGARVTVADRGPGIAPADLSRILDRFERAVSHRNYGGLGLGLYLAGQIVRAHGGNLQVVSAPGQGATFIVDL